MMLTDNQLPTLALYKIRLFVVQKTTQFLAQFVVIAHLDYCNFLTTHLTSVIKP